MREERGRQTEERDKEMIRWEMGECHPWHCSELCFFLASCWRILIDALLFIKYFYVVVGRQCNIIVKKSADFSAPKLASSPGLSLALRCLQHDSHTSAFSSLIVPASWIVVRIKWNNPDTAFNAVPGMKSA